MTRALVIADDLTGAAEIAGIGSRYGLPTRLVRDEIVQRPEAGLTVIDTDSRLLAPSDAASTVWKIVEPLRAGQFDLVYKKIDSVLRGPVLAEIDAMLSALAKPAAMLVPQNPSRGRVIRGGEYFVEGVPLYASAFANDPQYPARTSNALQILGCLPQRPTSCVDPGGEIASRGVTIGAASDVEDIGHWATRMSDPILPVGGADFFEAILQHRGHSATRRFITSLTDESILFVSGSASAYTHEMITRAEHRGIRVCAMPAKIFAGTERNGESMRTWSNEVIDALGHDPGRAIIAINQPLDRTPGAAERIQSALADLVASVLAQRRVSNILVSGGATASALCRRMNWRHFTISGELTSGVVQMQVASNDPQQLIVKPGSYRWPDAVWD